MQFIDVSGDVGGSKHGEGVELSVRGPDFAVLKAKVEEMVKKFKDSGLLTDIDTDFKDGATELDVVPNRERAAIAGVNVQDIADTINAAIGGVRAGKFTFGSRRYDVRLRLVPEQWENPGDITKLLIRTNFGELIPLSSVCSVEPEKKLLTITREMRQRAISVWGNVATGKSATTVTEYALKTARDILPVGYSAQTVGTSKDLNDTFASLGLLFELSLIVIYMTLAIQFNSFLNPLAILVAVPFTIPGALIGLAITHNSVNLYSAIAVKNSILLVEFFNQQRYIHHKPLREAVLIAAPIRLRPILMTSTATVCSMIPLVLGIGPGSEVRVSLGAVVIGGVVFSTLFALIVVPCVYSLLAPLEGNVNKSSDELDGYVPQMVTTEADVAVQRTWPGFFRSILLILTAPFRLISRLFARRP